MPGVRAAWAWRDPLHLARLRLHQVIKERAYLARGRLLDVGCGGQPYRDLFRHVDRYIGVDVWRDARIDVVGDGQRLPFREATFDTVLCFEMLEHVPEPLRLLQEVARTLRAGGKLILTAPQTWGPHAEPCDFYRYTEYGLRWLTERSGLRVLEVAPTSGIWGTVAQRVADTVVYSYAKTWPRWVVALLSVPLGLLQLTGHLLDLALGRRGDTLDHVLVAAKEM